MRRVELFMAAAVLCITGTILDGWTAQPASRYLLTVAIVDDHTVRLDENEELLSVDLARSGGHVYSDKAPYQPLLGVPFYAPFRWVGGDAFPERVTDPTGDFHWGRWWVGFWTTAVPAALLCIVMRRLVTQRFPAVAVPVALSISLGTVLLPLGSVMFGHVLSALAVAAGWLMLRRSERSTLTSMTGGALLAFAVGTEYPAAIAVVCVLAALTRSTTWRERGAIAFGGALGALPMAIYHTIAFGGPLTTAYSGRRLANFDEPGLLGIYGIVAPQIDELQKAMIGDRGLLTLTPICAIAIGSAAIALLRRRDLRVDAALALASLGALWILSAGVDGYGGTSPGPRYLAPALPLLAIPLAAAWEKVPLVCWSAFAVGAVPMLLATLTIPLIETAYTQSFRLWIERALDLDLTESLLGLSFGPAGLLLMVGLGLACAGAAVVVDRGRQADQVLQGAPVIAPHRTR